MNLNPLIYFKILKQLTPSPLISIFNLPSPSGRGCEGWHLRWERVG
jgi:hypothetical protein